MTGLPEKFEGDKWECDWKPTYHPDWGENGQIHLDGERDFPIDGDADEIIDTLQDRVHELGGVCTHQEDDQTFEVTAQMGDLLYRMHYDDEGTVTQIDVRILENNNVVRNPEDHDPDWEPEYTRYSYDVDAIVEFYEEVAAPLLDALDNGDVEVSIEKDLDGENISPLNDEEDT